MKEKADPPAQISSIDLDRPNPAIPGNTAIDGTSTREETLSALQPDPTDTTAPADDSETAPTNAAGEETGN